MPQAPCQALYMFYVIYSYNNLRRSICLVLILLMRKLKPSKSLGLTHIPYTRDQHPTAVSVTPTYVRGNHI